MSYINTLHHLVSSLTPEEYARFLAEFQKNSGRRGRSPSVAKALLEDIREGKYGRLTREDNGSTEDSAFSMQCKRLLDDLLDFLAHHDNIPPADVIGPVALAKITVKKLFVFYQILGLRGLYQEAIATLNKILEICEQFEFYEDGIHALGDLTNLYSSMNDLKNYQRVTEKLYEFSRHFDAYRKALQIYNTAGLRIVFRPDSQLTDPEFEKDLHQLRQLYQEHNRPRVAWFYHQLAIRAHLIKKEYQQAEELGYQLMEIQKNSPSIGADSMFGATYNMIAHAQMHRFRFSYALESCYQAQYYFRHNRINLAMAKELEFLCRLYTNRLDKAEHLLEEILSYTSEKSEKFKWAFRHYLKACQYFAMGDFARANKILVMEVQEIDKDKEGYNINSRILDIIVLIENQMWDVVGMKINSFKKHMDRLVKQGHVNQRYFKIFSLLFDLQEHLFDFKKVWRMRQDTCRELASTDVEPMAWQILTSEVIPFHVWFESKVHGVPFYDVLEKYFQSRREPDVYFLEPASKSKIRPI